MTEAALDHLAEPAEKGKTHGGYADIARRLNALHPERPRPISRQLVERWYQCRGSNQFPERHSVEVAGGRALVLFDLQAVERWYVRERRGNPPIETIPLFQVDYRGHPIDAEQSARGGHPEVRESYRGSVLDL